MLSFQMEKRETEAQAIFFNPFTFCSSCERKFVVCQFIGEDTNGSYPCKRNKCTKFAKAKQFTSSGWKRPASKG
jgi:hypothetical protein